MRGVSMTSRKPASGRTPPGKVAAMNTIAGLRCSVMVLGVLASAGAQAQVIVGRTAGEASVSATGAARYTIPLTLPRARTAGARRSPYLRQPQRQRPARCGLPSHRSPQRSSAAATRWRRTAARRSRARLADRFCLDGQRLRLTAGVYGQSGSQYQAERETFARVTAIGTAGTGPASFRGRAQRRVDLRIRHDARCTRRVDQQHDAAGMGSEPEFVIATANYATSSMRRTLPRAATVRCASTTPATRRPAPCPTTRYGSTTRCGGGICRLDTSRAAS